MEINRIDGENMAANLDKRTRENIISLYQEGKTGYAIHKQLMLCRSTVYSIIKLYNETGSVEPRPSDVGAKLTISDEKLAEIKKLIDDEPSISIGKIKENLQLDVSETTIINAIKSRLNYTYKKKRSYQKGSLTKTWQKSAKSM